MSFTLKNVLGSAVELLDGTVVDPDGTVEVSETLHQETDDAYVTVRAGKNAVGKTDESFPGAGDGQIIWVDEDLYAAWPKAVWEKVVKETGKSKSVDSEEK